MRDGQHNRQMGKKVAIHSCTISHNAFDLNYLIVF